jgi:hypothetical protein
MVSGEREMVRQDEDGAKLGERAPFESSRQAEYEDSVPGEAGWDENEDDE